MTIHINYKNNSPKKPTTNLVLFVEEDFNIISQLNAIVKDSGQIGEFKIGNVEIKINSMEEYQNDLIKV